MAAPGLTEEVLGPSTPVDDGLPNDWRPEFPPTYPVMEHSSSIIRTVPRPSCAEIDEPDQEPMPPPAVSGEVIPSAETNFRRWVHHADRAEN